MAFRAEPRAPGRGGRRRPRWSAVWPWLNLLGVVAIVAVDWLTPAGVVVGILLCIPIILTSMHDDPRQIWLATVVAVVGFALAAGYGRGPLSPDTVWIPNRVFAFLTLPASAYLAGLLQRRRQQVESARDTALAARDLNRLLMSLLAHDLRTPLTLATQGLDYVGDASREGRPIDTALISDLRARLHRSLRAVEVVLAVARDARDEPDPRSGTAVPLSRVGAEIAAELESFASEAQRQGKTLVVRLQDLEERRLASQVDGLVLRQSLAILLDNAIRHAVPGEVRVEAALEDEALVVHIEDQGPGLSATSGAQRADSAGSGLGLELARALVARTGGSLAVERDAATGTRFALRLPLRSVSELPTRSET